MPRSVEHWMDRPFLTGRQIVLMMVTLGSVSVWLLLWFGD